MKTLQALVIINSDLQNVWEKWTNPKHVQKWNIPSEEWHCPFAENNVITNGKFFFRMEKKDGSHSFDYKGIYQQVEPQKSIETLLEDGRKSWISFEEYGGKVTITETFEPAENTDLELQKDFCQQVLLKFKNYTETKS